ncbi:MAG TPA: hypothetical protein VLC49_00320 [Solirubrobacteraceae bacterium]|nr:hypothetical protein [Solirubrobacteraceae bacterium]
MAELAIGIGMSHGPMVVCDAPTWLRIGELDRQSTLLIDTGGRPVTFDELARANGERYAEQASLERLERQCAQVKRSLARIKDEFAPAASRTSTGATAWIATIAGPAMSGSPCTSSPR